MVAPPKMLSQVFMSQFSISVRQGKASERLGLVQRGRLGCLPECGPGVGFHLHPVWVLLVRRKILRSNLDILHECQSLVSLETPWDRFGSLVEAGRA